LNDQLSFQQSRSFSGIRCGSGFLAPHGQSSLEIVSNQGHLCSLLPEAALNVGRRHETFKQNAIEKFIWQWFEKVGSACPPIIFDSNCPGTTVIVRHEFGQIIDLTECGEIGRRGKSGRELRLRLLCPIEMCVKHTPARRVIQTHV
jgi:hypothetical protein